MSEHLICDLRSHGFSVSVVDDAIEEASSIKKIMDYCKEYARKSKESLTSVFVISKTHKSQVIFYATPVDVGEGIRQTDQNQAHKEAAEKWTSCIFIDGKPLFVTADVTFETLAEVVPQMKMAGISKK